MDNVGGIAGWKWLFILEGVATILIGVRAPARSRSSAADPLAHQVLCLVFLPEFPHNSPFLSETETAIAVQRIAEDSGRRDIAGEDGETPLSGFYAAMKDPVVHLLALCLTFCVLSVSFNAFFREWLERDPFLGSPLTHPQPPSSAHSAIRAS